jgi:surface antigen
MHIRSFSYGRLGRLQLAVCSVFLSYAAGSYATNLGFLMDTPISYMKQRDLQQLNRAARTALDTKQDGEALDWNNDGTGNSVHVEGTITPLNTRKDGGRSCRTLAIVAKAKGQTQTWAPTACKDSTPDSKWQLLKQ